MNIETAVTTMIPSREINSEMYSCTQGIMSAADLLKRIEANKIKFNHFDLKFDDNIRKTVMENLYSDTEFYKIMVNEQNEIILEHNKIVADLLNIASLPVDDETGYVTKAQNTVLLLEYVD